MKPSSDYPYHCSSCDKVFKAEDALNDHNFDKHNIKKPRKTEPDNEYTEADYQTWLRL